MAAIKPRKYRRHLAATPTNSFALSFPDYGVVTINEIPPTLRRLSEFAISEVMHNFVQRLLDEKLLVFEDLPRELPMLLYSITGNIRIGGVPRHKDVLAIRFQKEITHILEQYRAEQIHRLLCAQTAVDIRPRPKPIVIDATLSHKEQSKEIEAIVEELWATINQE